MRSFIQLNKACCFTLIEIRSSRSQDGSESPSCVNHQLRRQIVCVYDTLCSVSSPPTRVASPLLRLAACVLKMGSESPSCADHQLRRQIICVYDTLCSVSSPPTRVASPLLRLAVRVLKRAWNHHCLYSIIDFAVELRSFTTYIP
jgi:hypothetical protein